MLLASLFVENKLAKVNPSAATHLLVYAEMAFSALMVHSVMSSCGASWHCFIRYIDGIFACFGHVGCPFGCAFLSFFYRLHTAKRAISKGILKGHVHLLSMGKACSLALLPCLLAIVFFVNGFAVLGVGIVIHYHLVGVPVAFAWQDNVCACVFEHGCEVG